MTDSRLLVEQAEGNFLDVFDAESASIVADPDSLERVKKREKTQERPLAPRMTPDNSW